MLLWVEVVVMVVVGLVVIKGLEVLVEERRETLEEWGEGKEEETLATEDKITGIEGGGIECEEDGFSEILSNLFNKSIHINLRISLRLMHSYIALD